jgi:histidyl-tRNA synthetase
MKTVRGFRDLYAEDALKINEVSRVCLKEGERFGCEYIILPTVEYKELFERSIQDSDIVRKELIRIDNEDRNQCLRPEGTASAIRHVIERGIIEGRLMYFGSFYRNERPQKGRFKEFRQFGVELVSARPGVLEEIDMFMIIQNIMKKLKIPYTIRINNIGTFEDRVKYESVLKEYVEKNIDKYSDESKGRLGNGGLFRILDSKLDIEVNKNAPKIWDYISDKSRNELQNVINFFESMNIDYVIDPYLVRGLDYYAGNVFEITSNVYSVDSCHTAIGGGGRYDGLAKQLGSKVINRSIGFALGIDRLIECYKYESKGLPFLKIVCNKGFSPKLIDIYKEHMNQYRIITVCQGEKISGPYEFAKVIYMED